MKFVVRVVPKRGKNNFSDDAATDHANGGRGGTCSVFRTDSCLQHDVNEMHDENEIPVALLS
ncbi:MAG: hypothetical protein D3910_02730 [Candidatus Electrothrix sp. ATG2]|nr:hypothetical protein [Candidatus Electrothrix sp. ATG2]